MPHCSGIESMSVLDAAIGQLDANERWLSKHCKGLGRACASASFASVPWIQVDQVEKDYTTLQLTKRPIILPLLVLSSKCLFLEHWKSRRESLSARRRTESRFTTQILTQCRPLAEQRFFFEAHNRLLRKARSITEKDQVVQGKARVLQGGTRGGARLEGEHQG
jgi:hypothetical protein